MVLGLLFLLVRAFQQLALVLVKYFFVSGLEDSFIDVLELLFLVWDLGISWLVLLSSLRDHVAAY